MKKDAIGSKQKPTAAIVKLPDTEDSLSKRRFPIIAIGASAGGLAAYETFFSAMPSTTVSGMSFIIVQHLSPDYKSILSELIGRYTKMSVYEVTDGLIVKPNSAYIIPPNKDRDCS